jgi:hypothetical protein
MRHLRPQNVQYIAASLTNGQYCPLLYQGLYRIPSYFRRKMATDQASKPVIPEEDLRSFSEYLQGCTRIMALLGAGLSASSGLPTFRGAGGLWRSMDATSLATNAAFMRDPGLVWQFYSYRRHMALNANPNRAHFALAELAKKKDFITVSQNVDGELENLLPTAYPYETDMFVLRRTVSTRRPPP